MGNWGTIKYYSRRKNLQVFTSNLNRPSFFFGGFFRYKLIDIVYYILCIYVIYIM